MITGKSESKILTKDRSYDCKCRFDGKKYNSDQWWNNDKLWCECKKLYLHEKDYIWNSAKYSCENGKYSATIMVDSVTTCDEVIDTEAKSCDDETKTVPTNFNE